MSTGGPVILCRGTQREGSRWEQNIKKAASSSIRSNKVTLWYKADNIIGCNVRWMLCIEGGRADG